MTRRVFLQLLLARLAVATIDGCVRCPFPIIRTRDSFDNKKWDSPGLKISYLVSSPLASNPVDRPSCTYAYLYASQPRGLVERLVHDFSIPRPTKWWREPWNPKYADVAFDYAKLCCSLWSCRIVQALTWGGLVTLVSELILRTKFAMWILH